MAKETDIVELVNWKSDKKKIQKNQAGKTKQNNFLKKKKIQKEGKRKDTRKRFTICKNNTRSGARSYRRNIEEIMAEYFLNPVKCINLLTEESLQLLRKINKKKSTSRHNC